MHESNRQDDSLLGRRSAAAQSAWSQFWGLCWSSAQYVFAETKRHPRSFGIGVATVFLVVFFVTVLQNAVQSSPIIFFKLSEDTAGCNDYVMSPALASATAFPLINHTKVNSTEGGVSAVWGSAPRWAVLGQATNPTAAPIPPATTVPSTTVIALLTDAAQERYLQIGRALNLPQMAVSECFASSTIMRQLNLPSAAGSTTSPAPAITIQLDVFQILTTINVVSSTPTEEQLQALLLVAGVPAGADRSHFS
jgi:hypothetical protein